MIWLKISLLASAAAYAQLTTLWMSSAFNNTPHPALPTVTIISDGYKQCNLSRLQVFRDAPRELVLHDPWLLEAVKSVQDPRWDAAYFQVKMLRQHTSSMMGPYLENKCRLVDNKYGETCHLYAALAAYEELLAILEDKLRGVRYQSCIGMVNICSRIWWDLRLLRGPLPHLQERIDAYKLALEEDLLVPLHELESTLYKVQPRLETSQRLLDAWMSWMCGLGNNESRGFKTRWPYCPWPTHDIQPIMLETASDAVEQTIGALEDLIKSIKPASFEDKRFEIIDEFKAEMARRESERKAASDSERKLTTESKETKKVPEKKTRDRGASSKQTSTNQPTRHASPSGNKEAKASQSQDHGYAEVPGAEFEYVDYFARFFESLRFFPILVWEYVLILGHGVAFAATYTWQVMQRQGDFVQTFLDWYQSPTISRAWIEDHLKLVEGCFKSLISFTWNLFTRRIPGGLLDSLTWLTSPNFGLGGWRQELYTMITGRKPIDVDAVDRRLLERGMGGTKAWLNTAWTIVFPLLVIAHILSVRTGYLHPQATVLAPSSD